MLRIIVPLTALLLGVFCLLMGTGLLSTLLAVRADSDGFGSGWLGWIMSAYFGGFFFGTLAAPHLIRRMGHIRTFAMGAAILSCLALGHGLLPTPWSWLLFRGMTGMVLVTLYTVVESWLNMRATIEHRGRIFAAYMMTNLGALAIGQQLLKVSPPEGQTLFELVAILICFSVIPVTWTRLQQPEPVERVRMNVRRLYERAPLAALGAAGSGLAMGAFWGMAPAFARALQLEESHIANFMSLAILGGAVLQLPIGRYSDRADRGRALIVACLGGAVLALLVGLAGATHFGLLPAIFLYGGVAFSIYPICAAHLIDQLSRDEVVGGTGTLLLLNGVGAAGGPVLAGYLMEYFGPLALPACWAVVLTAIAIAARVIWGRSQLREPQPAQFVPMLRTTPTVLEMIPGQEQLPSAPQPDSGEPRAAGSAAAHGSGTLH